MEASPTPPTQGPRKLWLVFLITICIPFAVLGVWLRQGGELSNLAAWTLLYAGTGVLCAFACGMMVRRLLKTPDAPILGWLTFVGLFLLYGIAVFAGCHYTLRELLK